MQSWRGIGIAWTEQGIFDKAQEAFTTALGLTERSEKALKTDLYFTWQMPCIIRANIRNVWKPVRNS